MPSTCARSICRSRYPFETSFGVTTARRILLVELEADGLTGWGECVAGEHPYFSDETIDTAWLMHRDTSLRPALLEAELRHGGNCPEIFQPGARQSHGQGRARKRGLGPRSAGEGVSLAELLGGTRDTIPCGVSIGIQPSLRATDGQDRNRAGRRLSAHQAQVQARLGHQHLRSRPQALARHPAQLRRQLRLPDEGHRPHRRAGTRSTC